MKNIRYIAIARMRGMGIDGPINIPYGTPAEAEDGVIRSMGKIVCRTKCFNAHQFFAWNDDGHGLERGALTIAIKRKLEKRDKGHQARWDRVWEDEICQKYRRKDHEDYFLWDHRFYSAPVEDLRYIAELVGAKPKGE